MLSFNLGGIILYLQVGIRTSIYYYVIILRTYNNTRSNNSVHNTVLANHYSDHFRNNARGGGA